MTVKHIADYIAPAPVLLDLDLDAIGDLEGTGLVERISEGVAALRAIGVGAATSIPARSDADGRYQPLDADLTTLAGAITAAGHAIAAAANAGAQRTALGLGTAAVLNEGVGAGDLITLATAVSAFAIAVHTHAAADIVSGTLAVARGGTNLGSYTAGDLLYATGATTIAKLPIGSAGQVLTVTGGVPTWETPLGG